MKYADLIVWILEIDFWMLEMNWIALNWGGLNVICEFDFYFREQQQQL